MKDIARELGVSVATVSRALKGSTRISREKREAIVAYAREHKFSPNPMAESLRNRRTMKIIGVIIPQFTHFYFSSILAGIEDEALKYGYRLLVAQSDEDYEREVETCRAFYENKVCGIIVSQSKNTYSYDHFHELMDKGVPLVFYDRICTGVNSSRVTVDDYMGAYAAVEYMINTGCRRIAFYGSSMKMEISKNRYNGWHDALRKHGLDPEGCVRMFTNGQRAVACDPMLTTVEQNGYEVGRLAADILIGKAEGRIPVDKVEKRVVRTRLIVRGTTKTM